MKKLLNILTPITLTLMTLLSCNNADSNSLAISLTDNWFFKSTDDSVWNRATVPGCVHTDLIDNGRIEDPYYRLNEHDLQWIDKKDWEYRCSFQLTSDILAKDKIELNFKGLDTYADVYLNEQLILKADNMFIGWQIDCKAYLKSGENMLRILFHSPIKKGLEKLQNLSYTLPNPPNDLSEIGGLDDKKVSVFSRKAGYHFGWDWGPRLVTSGIWKDIELLAWNDISIQDIQIIQKNLTEEKANLLASLELRATKEISIILHGKLDSNIVFSSKHNLSSGINKIEIPIHIENPELWWPNGLGNQKLYKLDILAQVQETTLASSSTNIGLRTIKLIQEPDEDGKSFYFEINGHPVFMKGANYIPQDVFLNRVSNAHYEKLIKSAVDANLNMLRVWGGGVYEKKIFYELCDQYGLLVWQDFMFACAMYPGDASFLNSVKEEATYQVKRLRNHPCIALWCGNNENLSAWEAWGWKKNIIKEQGQAIADSIWKAYDDVFHNILAKAVEQHDADRLYWSSSPSAGMGILENLNAGDMHYWGVWWAKEPFSKYEEVIPRFMSEYGFQSFPEFNSVKKYTIEEDWDIYSEVMKSHQRSSIGNVTIEEYLLRDYKKPKDFEHFLYVGQLLQARGIKIAIEAHRRNMPYCMGSLYWQINDCWPVASWSGIDYYGAWKALHYTVKEAYKNAILSVELEKKQANVYIISDELSPTKANLKISLMTFNGDILHEENTTATIDAISSKIHLSKDLKKYFAGYKPEQLVLLTELTDDEGDFTDNDLSYFVRPKDLSLTNPDLSVKIKQVNNNSFLITISTDKLAKNIFLSAGTEGFFSDNYFDLLPNQSKEVLFTSEQSTSLDSLNKNLKTITLIDSY